MWFSLDDGDDGLLSHLLSAMEPVHLLLDVLHNLEEHPRSRRVPVMPPHLYPKYFAIMVLAE